jgi:DNA-binding MarR family transcriptional regulator
MHIDPNTSEHNDIPHRLLAVLPLVMRVMAAQMRETQHALSTGHMPVLAALQFAPRTQSDLAEMMSVSGATMSNTLTALEQRGWIERQRSHEDRRVVYAVLTQAGHTALDESTREMQQQIQQLIVGLDDHKRQRLLDGLDILEEVYLAALRKLDAQGANVHIAYKDWGKAPPNTTE